MAIEILVSPPQVVPAFNPIIFVFQTPKARYAQVQADLAKETDPQKKEKLVRLLKYLEDNKEQDTIDPIGITVQAVDTRFHVVLIREPDNQGKAEIDISYIIRRGFANEFNNASQTFTYYDGNLLVNYSVASNLEQEAAFTGFAINSVRQPDQGLIPNGMIPLTQTPMVRYVGYPLDYTFQQIPRITRNLKVVYSGGSGSQDNYMPTPIGNVKLSGGHRDIERVVINGPSPDGLIFESDVQEGLTPADPFYIRWINSLAGWNYHMFSIHKQEVKVSDYVATQSQGGHRAVALDVSRTVTVARSLIFREEFDILAGVALSPRIEWYNETLKVWQVVVISEDVTTKWNPRNAFGEIEYTFLLPKLLTQF